MAKCGHCQDLTVYVCMSVFCQHESATTVQDAVVKLIRRAAEIEKLRSEDGHVSNKGPKLGGCPLHTL